MLVSHPEQLAHKLGAVAKVLLDQLAANLATETWSNLGLLLCYKKKQATQSMILTTLRKVALVWFATALASKVFPVPGGP